MLDANNKAPENMQAPWKRRAGKWLRVANIALLAVTLAYVAQHLWEKWPQFRLMDLQVRADMIAAAIVLTLVYQIFYAYGWVLAGKCSRIRIGSIASMGIWGFSLFGKYLPGKIATPTYRAFILGIRQQASPTQVVLAWSLESVTSLLAGMIVVALLASILGIKSLGIDLPIGNLIGLILGIFTVCAVGLYKPVRKRFFKLLDLQAATDAVSWPALIGLVAYYICGWFLLGAILWLIVAAFRNADISFTTAVLTYAAAGLAGMLSVITPSGLGIRESAMTLMLGSHTGPAAAFTIALLARIISIIGEIAAIGAGYCIIRLLKLETLPDTGEKNADARA